MPAEEAGGLDRPIADAETILGVLVRHEVDFLLAGGYAVQVHGHVRNTRDVDIIPNPVSDNMRRLAAALTELEAAAVDDRGRRLPLDLSHPESLALGNYFLTTRAGALDLFNGPRPDLHRYRRLAESAVSLRLFGHPVRAVGRDDLLEMKRRAGRDQDLRDIAALTEVERGGGIEPDEKPQ